MSFVRWRGGESATESGEAGRSIAAPGVHKHRELARILSLNTSRVAPCAAIVGIETAVLDGLGSPTRRRATR